MAVAEHQILGGKHFLIFGPESGKIWCVKKRTTCPEKVPLPVGTAAGNLLRPLELVPASRERVVPTEWQVRTVLGGHNSNVATNVSRSASMAASPTIGDDKSLNKWARQITSQPVKLHCWPLTGPLRILGFLGSLIDFESQKIKKTVLSTTVAELSS